MQHLVLPTLGWALALLACTAPAQAVVAAPGFKAPEVLHETAAANVRGFVPLPGRDEFVVGLGRVLELHRPNTAVRALHQLAPGEAFGCLARTPAGAILVGELFSGWLSEIDPTTGLRLRAFAGPKNAFDAIALPSGDVLLNANPAWPTSGSHCGVWLAGPHRTPRELIALVGPSGPLALAPNGDLVVAELGATVPPPPGTARLLRFAANLVQQAIQTGAALTSSQATAAAAGYDGIYDLAFDDRGRAYTTDPASARVTQSAPGVLAPAATIADVGSGRSGLWLHQLERPTGGAPFAAYQPTERAGSLLIAHSDFLQRFAVARLEPARATLTSSGGGSLAAASSTTLTFAGAPPNALAATLLAFGSPTAEHAAVTLHGLPVWLGFPTAAFASALPMPATDTAGRTAHTFTNPGGYALTVTAQAIALATTPNATVHATSVPLALQLLP